MALSVWFLAIWILMCAIFILGGQVTVPLFLWPENSTEVFVRVSILNALNTLVSMCFIHFAHWAVRLTWQLRLQVWVSSWWRRRAVPILALWIRWGHHVSDLLHQWVFVLCLWNLVNDMGALIGFTLLRLAERLSMSPWLIQLSLLNGRSTLMILLCFVLLLLFLIGQINILRNFINPLSELTSLRHSGLLLLVVGFICNLLFLCSVWLGAEIGVHRVVKLSIHRMVLHRLLGFQVRILEHVFAFHQARDRLVLLVGDQMRVLAHESSFLWGLVVGEDRLAWGQALRCDVVLHTGADGGGFWFGTHIADTVHRPHMVLSKLRFHVEAVLQVFELLYSSFGLVVDLTTLSVLILVDHKPRLDLMSTLVPIDTLIFNSNTRSSIQSILGAISVLLLEVRDILKVLTLGIVTCHIPGALVTGNACSELLRILWLNSSDELVQELFFILNLWIVNDFIHQIIFIFMTTHVKRNVIDIKAFTMVLC